MLRKLKLDGWKARVKLQVYRGIVPYQPFDHEATEQARSTRWSLLLSDVGVGCYTFFLTYSMFVVSLKYTSTDVKAVFIK